MRSLTFVALLGLVSLTFASETEARGGGRGGHYIGGVGSSHKGGHYYNPRTGNHYQHRHGVEPASAPSFTPAHTEVINTGSAAPGDHVRVVDPAKVSIVSFSWRKQDGAMVASFRIRNTNSYPVKDVLVRCTHSVQTTTVYRAGSNTQTIGQVIAPADEISVNETNMGAIGSDVAGASCITANYSPAM